MTIAIERADEHGYRLRGTRVSWERVRDTLSPTSVLLRSRIDAALTASTTSSVTVEMSADEYRTVSRLIGAQNG